MPRPLKPYAGFLFKDGQAYALTTQQLLGRYRELLDSQVGFSIASNEEGIAYEIGPVTITVPRTSECFEFLQWCAAQGFAETWYARNPGCLLTKAMDEQGDLLIATYGLGTFQSIRQRAAIRDEGYLRRLGRTNGKATLRIVQ